MMLACVAAGVLAALEKCDYEHPSCPAGLHCDKAEQRCVHEPRQLGEPCGTEPQRHCAAKMPGTSTRLTCSTWCGTCVVDRSAAAEAENAAAAAAAAAGPSAAVTRCGLSSNTTFTNFEASIMTKMPVMYPKNDADLEHVMRTAWAHNCTVRPVGATHTSSPVVAAASETDAVGLSLAEYQPDDEAWRMSLDTAGSKVRASAGTSLFDLYRAIRPEGFFLPTQTAGPIFTLGGVVSNSVHGGVYGKGYLNQYATALRVATFTAAGAVEFRVVTDEAELRAWRNGFGLLGVMTAVELRVERRERFAVFTQRRSFTNFSREAVEEYFGALAKEELYSESFFNPYSPEVLSVLFKKAEDIPAECSGVTDDTCKWSYPHAKCENPTCCHYLYKFGDVNLDQSCRALYNEPTKASVAAQYTTLAPGFKNIPYNGAPDLPAGQNAEVCLLEKMDELPHFNLELAFYDQTFSQIENEVLTNSRDVNDGFYLRAVPHSIRLLAYSVPRENLYDLLALVRDVYTEVSKKTGITQLGNAEFRFFNITDAAVLSPTTAQTKQPPTGEYVNCECVFMDYEGSPNRWWTTTLMKYEQRARALNGVVHTGKSFCYGEDAAGQPQPYQNKTCIKEIFNNAQKAEFTAWRKKLDPHNLFDGGAAKEFF